MNLIKTFILVSAVSIFSAGAFAQSISATSSTLDGAEAKIAAQASQQGDSYTITSARVGNQVHMTAELNK